MNKKLAGLLFLIVFMLPVMAQNEDILNRIKQIENEFAPDKRVVVFDVKLLQDSDVLSLEGEISCKRAFEKINEMTSEKLKNNVRMIPDHAIGDKSYGVIYNSMGTIHRAAAYSSETVTQTLMGTPVRVLDKKGGWYRIQTPDRYIGWINGAVSLMTKDEQADYYCNPKIIVTSLFASSYQQADVSSQIVSDLVIGNVLAVNEELDGFFKVLYPDGREAYVLTKDAIDMENWLPNQTQQSVVDVAKLFMGVPYVWGGTSSKGLDCSGFTKIVYFMHNIILPRDASQQVMTGLLVDETKEFEKLEPGDLVFFGDKVTDEQPKERVVHVGIYIGSYRFIHASDYIKINSFNPEDELYDEFNTNRYLRTKRVLGEDGYRSAMSVFACDKGN